ncbi:uncharacterized protein N7511_005403 [Penicillium nucicola]|uniref:uncharacterized protein n=1 Tax=Penicillium nucicola TaxID=1850975 RepID=UPI002544D55C|nr:uncharacterized protein N7511_005403 [Penicillium nucicola]KAJ5762021.1 hypothetical protein N7511_005403 [Penicillium nucicola]
MDQEEAPPPPYSAVDPLITPARNGNPAPAPPRGGVSESQDASSSRIPPQPAVVPTHFRSASTYFEERPPSSLDDPRDILQHHITIYPRSQAKDFPRRPRCWASRLDEVTQQDWDTFLRYLFPPELGLAASSQHLPRQLRAEIRRDRKDRPQETDEQRKARIAAVVAEWNECFFGYRSTQIVPVYVGEPDNAPSSGLCHRCYPAATGSIDSQPPRNQNAPSPVSGQQNPSPTHWQPAPYHSPPVHAPHSPYGVPYGAPTYPSPMSPNHQPPQYYPVPYHPPPQSVAPWQWNNWNYAQQQQQNSNNGMSKGGSLGWISQLASQAQKYGERFSEQAQQYGDQISAQAQHYGRQVEEQALAHGRWLEEQARLHGRKAPMTAPSGYYGRPAWDNPPQHAVNVPMSPVQHPSPSPATSVNTSASRPGPTKEAIDKSKPSTERSRRGSVDSVSSESSFSSIDSISTSSNLSVSDLATVRTQLELLDDRHDRTLYDAAVALRQQLTALQTSRREDKISGRKDWRKQGQESNSDWGRWESPEQQERTSVDRRAMKDEMRATKKVFKDVLRRAREEQRERRRLHRRQVRQARASEGDQPKNDQPLEQQLGILRLDGTPVVPRPATTPAQPTQVAASNASIASFESESNPPSMLRASTQDFATGTNKKTKPTDTSSRIKDLLKSRKAKKKQKNEEADGESK